MVHRYPDSQKLCNKDVFADLLKLASSIDPEAYDFVPTSFNLPHDANDFSLYMRKYSGATYIAKPMVGSKGKNITLFQQMTELSQDMMRSELTV